MSWIDWCILLIPMSCLIALAVYTKRYARSVADYLVAGRVAGRYIICVGDLMAALSVIYLIQMTEQYYNAGFSLSFWNAVANPIWIFLALSGFCIYRWRETRCLSIGQFLELRYGSKFFRIFCATIRTIAEMVTNAIGPAIAANFFIYFLGLPHRIMIFGVNLPCYGIVVGLCLLLALIFILPGGRISLLITDAIQGMVSYPIFVMIIGYVLLYFSWGEDILPAMQNRVDGQSFINPYDMEQLTNFNIFSLIVTVFGGILNRASWIGNDISGAGKTPHEQKMGNLIGTFRSGMSTMMIIVLAMITISFMNNEKFKTSSNFGISNTEVRLALSNKILDEVVENKEVREQTKLNLTTVNDRFTHEDWERPNSQTDNPDTPYMDTVRSTLGDTPQARLEFQKFRSLYSQMLTPVLLSKIFPVGMIGLFCLLMIMLLISTDDSRIFNAASTLVQDIILPLCKNQLSPTAHIWILRFASIGVAIFFFIVSLFFAQLDYILMFTTIMCSLWLGGAGPIMVGGLYTRFGNLVGAWCAIIFGCGTSLFGLICQRNWADIIYPFLERHGWVDNVAKILEVAGSPFYPYIQWEMDSVKFPINSFEIYFISMILAIATYILGSLITYKPYNLEKLLHRGEYADENSIPLVKEKWTLKNIFNKLVNITPEYTLGDKIIAYSVFGYSFVYLILISFCGAVIWNLFYSWPIKWWSIYFFITSLIVPSIVGIISTVWLTWGGVKDIKQLFIDLKNVKEDDSDNGQVLEK